MIISNMIYVNDVQAMCAFWRGLGFVVIKKEILEGYFTITMAPTKDSTTQFQLWDLAFIKQFSPEVADLKPAILFKVENLEAWHKHISSITDTTGEIEDNGDKLSFNFADPEGNFYAVTEK